MKRVQNRFSNAPCSTYVHFPYHGSSGSTARKSKLKSSNKSISNKEIKRDVSGHDINNLLSIVLGSNEAQKDLVQQYSQYTLGDENWQPFWLASLNSIEQRRILPEIGDQSNLSAKTNVLSDIQEDQSEFLSEIDEKNCIISELSITKLPERRNFKPQLLHKNDNKEISPQVLTRAVNSLSKSKQTYLLKVLEQMETELGLSDGEGEESKTNTIKPKSNSSHPSNSSRQLKPLRNTGTYGVSHIYTNDETTQLLKKIGIAMENEKFKALYYDLTGRGDFRWLGPAALREKMYSELELKLTSREIAILLKKFDSDNRGAVKFVDVLGNAKLIYQKHVADIRKKNSKKPRRKLSTTSAMSSTAPPVLVESASAPAALVFDPLDGSADPHTQLLEKLAEFAYVAMETNNIHPLNISKPRVNLREFRNLLEQLDMEFTPQELVLLQKRYTHSTPNIIDVPSFRNEVKSLGSALLQEKQQEEARASFIRVLSRRGTENDEFMADTYIATEDDAIFRAEGSRLDNDTDDLVEVQGASSSTRTSPITRQHNPTSGIDHTGTVRELRSGQSCRSVTGSVVSRISNDSASRMSTGSQTTRMMRVEVTDDILSSAEAMYIARPTYTNINNLNNNNHNKISEMNANTITSSHRKSSDNSTANTVKNFQDSKPDELDNDIMNSNSSDSEDTENDAFANYLRNSICQQDGGGGSGDLRISISSDLYSLGFHSLDSDSKALSTGSGGSVEDSKETEDKLAVKRVKDRIIRDSKVRARSVDSISGAGSRVGSVSVSGSTASAASRFTGGTYNRGLATSGAQRGLTIAKSSRGLLPEVPKPMPVVYTSQQRDVFEWRTEGLMEDGIGSAEIPMGGPMDWDMEGGRSDYLEDDDEEEEDEERDRSDQEDNDDNEDEDDDDDDLEGQSATDSSYAATEQRVGRVEEVLRLAEDILRMASGVALEREKEIPVNETRDDEEDDEALLGLEDEDEDEDEEDDYEELSLPGYGEEEEEEDGNEESHNNRLNSDPDKEDNNMSENVETDVLKSGYTSTSNSESEGDPGDETISKSHSNYKTKFRAQFGQSNNQEEDQKDELRTKSRLLEAKANDDEDDDESYDFDE